MQSSGNTARFPWNFLVGFLAVLFAGGAFTYVFILQTSAPLPQEDVREEVSAPASSEQKPLKKPQEPAEPPPASELPRSVAVESKDFLVEPYLVYPADKPLYPEYERAVAEYLEELREWYYQQTGSAFTMRKLQVARSHRNYTAMRCGEIPAQTCLQDPAKLEGNWAKYMNEAVHGGVETHFAGGPAWDKDTVFLVFGAGGGGFAGANADGKNGGWAVVGDWVLEPLSGVPNTWGIPCSASDAWQCAGGVPKGTPAHELGHAFGLPHPGPQYRDQTIMEWHGNYPDVGFLPQEIEFLKTSPFFARP